MPKPSFTAGPWRVVDRRPVTGNWASRIPFAIEKVSDTHKAVIPIADVCDQPNAKANARLISAAPELLEDAKSTDQGYDWFLEELLSFRNYFGAQTVKQTEAFIDSLIAHLGSRQIGTRAAIARAEGGQS